MFNVVHSNDYRHAACTLSIHDKSLLNSAETYTKRDIFTDMTRGQRIKTLRMKLKMSQLQLALACGWKSKSRVSNYETDFREPSTKDVQKMANALGVSASWLDYGDGKIPAPRHTEFVDLTYSIPVLSWSEVIIWHNCTDDLKKDLIKNREKIVMCEKGYEGCYGLRVTNDLMEPTAKIGETIIVDRICPPKDGSLVVACIPGAQEAMFKKYTIDGHKRYLRSISGDIDKIDVDEKVKILGVVIRIKPPDRIVEH